MCVCVCVCVSPDLDRIMARWTSTHAHHYYCSANDYVAKQIAKERTTDQDVCEQGTSAISIHPTGDNLALTKQFKCFDYTGLNLRALLLPH